jgi:hypothetical protein
MFLLKSLGLSLSPKQFSIQNLESYVKLCNLIIQKLRPQHLEHLELSGFLTKNTFPALVEPLKPTLKSCKLDYIGFKDKKDVHEAVALFQDCACCLEVKWTHLTLTPLLLVSDMRFVHVQGSNNMTTDPVAYHWKKDWKSKQKGLVNGQEGVDYPYQVPDYIVIRLEDCKSWWMEHLRSPS